MSTLDQFRYIIVRMAAHDPLALRRLIESNGKDMCGIINELHPDLKATPAEVRQCTYHETTVNS